MALLKDILSSHTFNSVDFKKHPVEFMKEKSWKIPFESYSDVITSLSELANNDSKRKTITRLVKKISENDSTLRAALNNTNQKYLAKEFGILRSLVLPENELTECIHEPAITDDILAESIDLNAEDAKSYFYSRFNHKDKNYTKAVSLDNRISKYDYDNKPCTIKFVNGSLTGDATIIVTVEDGDMGKYAITKAVLKETKAFKSMLNRIVKRFKRSTSQKTLPEVKNTVEFLISNNSNVISKSDIINILDRELDGFDVKNNVV